MTASPVAVSLLTGGTDKHYAFGLATSLASRGLALDVIGSSEIECPEFHDTQNIVFLKLRGSQERDAPILEKGLRISKYYLNLIGYAVRAKPKLFHILWNNRFEFTDRVLLMSFYRLLGKKVVLTAHNVNAAKRDQTDSALNRFTLRIQYTLANHIFVHTAAMKRELMTDFGVPEVRITTIPFGINTSVPRTGLTPIEAKRRLGIHSSEKVILFFGRIKPYKGLEYLVAAFRELQRTHDDHRLLVAGRAEKYDTAWKYMAEELQIYSQNGRALIIPEFIPDHEIELYFQAADVLVLPYRDIYQSGILLLALSFGLPVITAAVGPFKDEIIEGENGFLFKPEDPADLASTIKRYFASDLYTQLCRRREDIRRHAHQLHSWEIVANDTINVYAELLGDDSRGRESK